MRDSVDMDGIHDVRSRRAFFDREIVRRNPILEMELESTPNFSLSETRAVCDSLFGIAFGHICSLTFLITSSVALFRGSDSESTNGVCFAASWQAHKSMALEAPHFHAASLGIRPDACWINEWRLSFANTSSEGERYMTDTDHPVGHPSVHHQILGRVRRRRSCACHDDQFGPVAEFLAQFGQQKWSVFAGSRQAHEIIAPEAPFSCSISKHPPDAFGLTNGVFVRMLLPRVNGA